MEENGSGEEAITEKQDFSGLGEILAYYDKSSVKNLSIEFFFDTLYRVASKDKNPELQLQKELECIRIYVIFCRSKYKGFEFFSKFLSVDENRKKLIGSGHEITEELLGYSEMRIKYAQNPILLACYQGLIFAFKKQTKEERVKLSKLYCQTLLIIAKEDYFKYRNDIFEKVNSLLNIAKAIGNKDVLSEAVKALIDFERRHETALGDYAWRRSFELLVLDKKIKLSEEDENQIVCGIEKVFLRLIEEEVKLGNCPWSDIIKLGMLLGAYYKSNMNNHKKAQDVIRKAGHVCEEFANLNTGVNREMILRELYQTYLKVSLKDEAECVARLIKENGTEILSSMTMTESVIEIPHEVIKNYVDDIFKRNDKNNAIRELIKDNLPTTEMLCNQIRINKKEAPLLSIIAHINYSSDGVLMSYREPSTEDLCSEDDLVAELKNYLFIHILFFEKCLKEIFKQGHINEQVLLEFIASTHIRDKRRPIIKRGIEAYFANDFMTFLHLIIPQIEAILRNILEDNGGTVLKDGREGGFNYKTLDSLLGEEAVCEKLGEDLTRYLKGVYSHRLGLNLRNDICHGLWETKEGNKLESALVLHTLLCLTHLE